MVRRLRLRKESLEESVYAIPIRMVGNLRRRWFLLRNPIGEDNMAVPVKSPGSFITNQVLSLIPSDRLLGPREQTVVNAVASVMDIAFYISAAEIAVYGLLHPSPTFGMLSPGSRWTLATLASPITWMLALAVAGTKAQHRSITEEQSGVRGSGSFGVAPSLHLKGGKPWYQSLRG